MLDKLITRALEGHVINDSEYKTRHTKYLMVSGYSHDFKDKDYEINISIDNSGIALSFTKGPDILPEFQVYTNPDKTLPELIPSLVLKTSEPVYKILDPYMLIDIYNSIGSIKDLKGLSKVLSSFNPSLELVIEFTTLDSNETAKAHATKVLGDLSGFKLSFE